MKRLSIGRRVLVAFYLVAALAGLVGTWWFNLQYRPSDGSFVAGWFANAASSSAAVDVIVAATVACVFFVAEGRRIGWRSSWVMIPFAFAVAIAFALPLFLAVREVKLGARAPQPAP